MQVSSNYKTFTGIEYTNDFGLEKIFLDNLYELSRDCFLKTYEKIYPFIYSTPIEKERFVDGYVDLRKDEYYEVPTMGNWVYNEENDEYEIKVVNKYDIPTTMVLDGRNLLKINKGMSKEHFVYNMVKIITDHYEDGVNIECDFIINKCKEIWDNFIIDGNVNVKNKSFKLDYSYWFKKYNGKIDFFKVMGKIRHLMNSNDFKLFYDDTLTLEENIDVLRENGIRTKKSTLKKWLDDEGYYYTTNAQKKRNERNMVIIEVYNEDKSRSLREIEKIVNDRGYKVTDDTVNKVIKENKKEITYLRVEEDKVSYGVLKKIGSFRSETKKRNFLLNVV